MYKQETLGNGLTLTQTFYDSPFHTLTGRFYYDEIWVEYVDEIMKDIKQFVTKNRPKYVRTFVLNAGTDYTSFGFEMEIMNDDTCEWKGDILVDDTDQIHRDFNEEEIVEFCDEIVQRILESAMDHGFVQLEEEYDEDEF